MQARKAGNKEKRIGSRAATFRTTTQRAKAPPQDGERAFLRRTIATCANHCAAFAIVNSITAIIIAR